jgi:hypothetical protein
MEKGGKPLIENSTPFPIYLWFKKSIQKPELLELTALWLETSMKLYVHDFGFSTLSVIRIHFLCLGYTFCALDTLSVPRIMAVCTCTPEDKSGEPRYSIPIM